MESHRSNRSCVRRAATALGAATAAVALVLVSAGTGVAACPQGSRGAAAAGWLAGQVGSDGLVRGYDGSVDYPLTERLAIALDRLGGHDEVAQQVTAAVGSHVHEAITEGDPSQQVFAYPVVETLRLAEVSGADPRDFYGYDMVGQLEGLVDTSYEPGRVDNHQRQQSAISTDVQAQAVLALHEAGSPLADSTLSFLLQLQCSAGYFQDHLNDRYSGSQTCDDDDPTRSVPLAYATAYAVQTLASIGRVTPAQRQARHRAVRWLVSAQDADGGFAVDQGGDEDARATGAAALALQLVGRDRAAHGAVRWLRRHQLTTGPDRGAIALDRADLAAVANGAITDAQLRDRYRVATAEAAPALGRRGR